MVPRQNHSFRIIWYALKAIQVCQTTVMNIFDCIRKSLQVLLLFKNTSLTHTHTLKVFYCFSHYYVDRVIILITVLKLISGK